MYEDKLLKTARMLLEICFYQLRYQKSQYQVNIHCWSGISFALHIIKAHHFWFLPTFIEKYLDFLKRFLCS